MSGVSHKTLPTVGGFTLDCPLPGPSRTPPWPAGRGSFLWGPFGHRRAIGYVGSGLGRGFSRAGVVAAQLLVGGNEIPSTDTVRSRV